MCPSMSIDSSPPKIAAHTLSRIRGDADALPAVLYCACTYEDLRAPARRDRPRRATASAISLCNQEPQPSIK
jgi:hypothetical protein